MRRDSACGHALRPLLLLARPPIFFPSTNWVTSLNPTRLKRNASRCQRVTKYFKTRFIYHFRGRSSWILGLDLGFHLYIYISFPPVRCLSLHLAFALFANILLCCTSVSLSFSLFHSLVLSLSLFVSLCAHLSIVHIVTRWHPPSSYCFGALFDGGSLVRPPRPTATHCFLVVARPSVFSFSFLEHCEL